MNKQIILKLKNMMEEINNSASLDIETLRNVLKEELQYYILDFIYHHVDYSNWTMYGGSALRICHKLDRMSVDLDFEISESCTDTFLENLKSEIESYFLKTYDLSPEFLTLKVVGNRGLRLNFNIGAELGLDHPSKQVHIKIDLNCFSAPKTVTEKIPISHDQLSFVIKTYNMSALMASKIAAIFLRGSRGVGEARYEEKGRDIYDLLWYMQKNIIPDLDYLVAKNIDVSDLHGLFDKLTIQMDKVSDENLAQDLGSLFIDKNYVKNWVSSWRQNYFHLLKSYSILRVKELAEILVQQDLRSDNYSFIYHYNTEDSVSMRFIFNISDYWITFSDGDLPTQIDEKLIPFIGGENKGALNDKLKQYVTLFYEKTETYLKKTKHEVLSDLITTKVIRMTADNLKRNEQIVLNRSALLSCELDDLF